MSGWRRAWNRPEVRFIFVGGCNAVLNLALLWLLVARLSMNYLLACAILFFALNALGYVMNKSFTFRLGKTVRWDEVWRYFAVMAVSLGVNLALMALLVERFGIPYLAASVVVIVLLAAGNFVAHRGLSFADRGDRVTDTTAPLRVLQVSAFFPAHGGGIEVVAGHLARRLAAAGVQVTWMAGGPPAERPVVDEGGGSLLVDQAQSVDFVERRLGLPAPLWGLGALRRLWRHIGACDVVQVHDYLYMPTLLALLFARLRRRRVVLTQHVGEIAYESRAARLVLRVLNHTVGRIALGGVSQVVFVGRPVMDFFGGFVRYRTPPVLIANGVDHDVYRPAPSPGAPRDDATLRALFVGRFVEKKGLGLLRDCVSAPGIRWAFAGRGPLSPEHWGVPAGTVEMLGVLPPQAVADAMRDADLLVLPSHGEGFPLVVQEALACGTPVLVSQEVADAFPATDPRCVLAVDVGGVGAADRLRATLARVAADVPAIRSVRPDALALARQWSWERCVASYLAIYAEVRRR